MGGYASTPKKGKASEEGGEGSIRYVASGMQGWRSGMEDAHIALMIVPKGSPPSSQEIGAARIGSSVPQAYSRLINKKPPLGDSDSPNVTIPIGESNYYGHHFLGEISEAPERPARAWEGAMGARVRSSTYSAGDSEEAPPAPVKEAAPMDVDNDDGHADAANAQMNIPMKRGMLAGAKDKPAKAGAVEGLNEADAARVGAEVGAGWKAVDLLEDAALFGVFDGHGGKAVADFCKERLPGLLDASPAIRAGDWKKGFPQVYHALDGLLLSGEGQEKAGGWGGGSKVDGIGVGCTIVTALLDRKRGQCYVAHAGDSRCVLCRAGRAVQLTRDHKPGLPTEYARIVGAGGHVSRVGRVNDNLNLSRAIGDMAYKRNRLRDRKDQIISAEPDVCRFTMTPGVDEFLILACDGVWEMMNTTQVVAFVRAGLRAGNDLREVCESLLDACLSPDPRSTRYAGCDNMTVVLVLLQGWETALATRAHPQALTFTGGRLGGVAEAAAALSATLPKLPRRRESEPRPPLPLEFRESSQDNQEGTKAMTAAPAGEQARSGASSASTAVASSDTKQADGAVDTSVNSISSAASRNSQISERHESTAASPVNVMGADRSPGGQQPPLAPQHQQRPNVDDSTSLADGNRRRSDADAALRIARRIRAETANDWPPRRLSAGSTARSRPRSAHGIEFSLASFTTPPVPRTQVARMARPMSTRSTSSGSVIAAATAAGARPKSMNLSLIDANHHGGMSGGSPDSARRSAAHTRSATAPMLPTPLIHHRRRPSEERVAAAAAVAALAEVGAAGAVAVAASEEKAALRGSRTQETGEAQISLGDQAAGVNAAGGSGNRGSERGVGADGGERGALVFVPGPGSVIPVDVTVAVRSAGPSIGSSRNDGTGSDGAR